MALNGRLAETCTFKHLAGMPAWTSSALVDSTNTDRAATTEPCPIVTAGCTKHSGRQPSLIFDHDGPSEKIERRRGHHRTGEATSAAGRT